MFIPYRIAHAARSGPFFPERARERSGARRDSVLGRPGNNPYCHYRARTLAAQGKRERLVLREAAPGNPFDNGRFEIVEEAIDAPDVRPPTPRELVKKRAAVPVG